MVRPIPKTRGVSSDRQDPPTEPATARPARQTSRATSGAIGESALWRPVARSRAYESVIERVEEQITSGALRVGDRLPAERDLAGLLGVSRAAVREALRVLEAQGVVRAGVGAGPDGGTVLSSMPSAALTQMLRLHIALANFPMTDVIEARIMLERWSARLAAQQATGEDIAHLETFLGVMQGALNDRERFNEADTSFHVAIAETGRNRLVADLTTAIRDSMRGMILDSFRDHGTWEIVAPELLAQHEAILTAIEAHDGTRAADAIEAHIQFAFDAFGWVHLVPVDRTGTTD